MNHILSLRKFTYVVISSFQDIFKDGVDCHLLMKCHFTEQLHVRLNHNLIDNQVIAAASEMCVLKALVCWCVSYLPFWKAYIHV